MKDFLYIFNFDLLKFWIFFFRKLIFKKKNIFIFFITFSFLMKIGPKKILTSILYNCIGPISLAAHLLRKNQFFEIVHFVNKTQLPRNLLTKWAARLIGPMGLSSCSDLWYFRVLSLKLDYFSKNKKSFEISFELSKLHKQLNFKILRNENSKDSLKNWISSSRSLSCS